MDNRPTMKDLISFFNEVKRRGDDVVVKIKLPNQKEPEVIMNYNSSIDVKLEYYKNTYDDNLVHKNCKDIQIIDLLGTKIPF